MSNTRFAPCLKEGCFHISEARIAIYNWLIARRTGGKFVLRIDDINPLRFSSDLVAQITDGLRWLGLDWDDYFHQCTRVQDYEALCERLLAAGLAYRCYCTKSDIARERGAALANQQTYRYSGRCRYIPFDILSPYCVRLDVKKILGSANEMRCHDVILGNMCLKINEIDDLVIRRTDGTFTDDFATAVDDEYSNITHVIRDQEHLSSTIPQLVVLYAIGLINNTDRLMPVYGHVPYITGPHSVRRLSKRTADSLSICVTVNQYKAIGYLPETLVNGLAMLMPTETRALPRKTMSEMLEDFNLDKIPQCQVEFDPYKLYRLQRLWMQSYDRELLAEKIHRIYGTDRRLIEKIIPLTEGDLVLFSDFKEYLHFAEEKHFVIKGDAMSQLFAPGMTELLEKWLHAIENHRKWSHTELLRLLREVIDPDRMLPFLKALRVATTGRQHGIDVIEGMVLLGRKRTCRRLRAVLPIGKETVAVSDGTSI